MKYIGNYSHWIKQEWIDYLLNNDGDHMPRDFATEELNSLGIQALFTDGEWTPNCVCCITFKGDRFPFPIDFPIDTTGYQIEYWVLKLPVGMCQPMHQDYNSPNNTEEIRYWIALQDYEIGHLFIYHADKILTGYKKGDIFQYTDNKMWHAGGNIGKHTRLTLNLTLYK